VTSATSAPSRHRASGSKARADLASRLPAHLRFDHARRRAEPRADRRLRRARLRVYDRSLPPLARRSRAAGSAGARRLSKPENWCTKWRAVAANDLPQPRSSRFPSLRSRVRPPSSASRKDLEDGRMQEAPLPGPLSFARRLPGCRVSGDAREHPQGRPRPDRPGGPARSRLPDAVAGEPLCRPLALSKEDSWIPGSG
jgi:hypothetical protein